ncbi:MAG: hypothetical protein DMF15_05865 [Verrucomicrobia bacterium]|nr:MAG: hypothetical protein DMF15_05865 [Verrucomicrobiota bacterium]
MKVNERISGHRASVFSEENFSQIYPAFHRNFSCAPAIFVFPSASEGPPRRPLITQAHWMIAAPIAGSLGRHGAPGSHFFYSRKIVIASGVSRC